MIYCLTIKARRLLESYLSYYSVNADAMDDTAAKPIIKT